MSVPFVLFAALLAPDASDAAHVDASLELDGELLAWHFVDVDADGRDELCVAVRGASGRRLQVHDIEAERIVGEPRHVVPVLDDVLAFAVADVRDEPGRELVFLTRGGAWSYSLELDGYRGNVARLVERDLLYDVPDPGALPWWPYVVRVPGEAREQVILPDGAGFALWGPAATSEAGSAADPESVAGSASYVPLAEWSSDLRVNSSRPAGPRERGDDRGARFGVSGGLRAGVLLAGEGADVDVLLSAGRSYGAPALLDVDGDGRLDLLRLADEELHVYLATASGLPTQPTRTEAFPDYLSREDEDLELELVDLDGDGDVDLLARWTEERGGLESTRITLQFLANDGRRLLPKEPTQVMRFEAVVLRTEVVDVDGDRRPDLVVRKFELPSLLDTVTGLEFESTHLVFPGTGGGAFERRPALKHVETFNEESFLEAVANRSLKLDCDGDGVADLVEVDALGRIAIRRLKKRSGGLRGDSWSLDAHPWKRFDARGDIESLAVLDLNGDGLGDIVSGGERRLTVLLSRADRKAR